MSDSEDVGLDLDSVFTVSGGPASLSCACLQEVNGSQEPPRPPSPEPTFATYRREARDGGVPRDWSEITIRLVGSHPLWGHYLYAITGIPLCVEQP